jgi:hypothetical protein
MRLQKGGTQIFSWFITGHNFGSWSQTHLADRGSLPKLQKKANLEVRSRET